MGQQGNLREWADFIVRVGIVGVIALYLVWQNNNTFGSTLNTIRDEQRAHILQTSIYQRSICLSLAKLAQTDPNLCEPK